MVAQPWADGSLPMELLLPPQPGPCSQLPCGIMQSQTAAAFHFPSSHYLSMNETSPPRPCEHRSQAFLHGASDQQCWRVKVKKTTLPAIHPLSAEEAGMLPLPAGNVERIIHLSSDLMQFLVINTMLSISFRSSVIFPLL